MSEPVPAESNPEGPAAAKAGRRGGMGGVVFFTPGPMPAPPRRWRDQAWEYAAAADWKWPAEAGARGKKNLRVEGPDGEAYRVVGMAQAQATSRRLEVTGEALSSLGKLRCKPTVSLPAMRPHAPGASPGALGWGAQADAVAPRKLPRGDRLTLEASFDVCVGARQITTLQYREIRFAVLRPLGNAGEAGTRHVALCGDWRVDEAQSHERPVVLLRQERVGGSRPGVTGTVDLVFADLAAVARWQKAPALIFYNLKQGHFDKANTTQAAVQAGERLAASDHAPPAPPVPPLTAVAHAAAAGACPAWKRTTLNINDFGVNQTNDCFVRHAIPGMIDVSSFNDMIEKIKKAIHPGECQCLAVLNFFGHGNNGVQSVGAGHIQTPDRQIDASNVAVMGVQLKPLMCPNNSAIYFFGCLVGGRGGADGVGDGPDFLRAVAQATGAEAHGWTGEVTTEWSYDKDGNVVDVKTVPSGNEIVARP